MKTTKILIDTDIGDDVDDALALALAANSPELELLGVTTVYRNTPRRAQLARTLLRELGLDSVPVAAGTTLPLRKEADASAVPFQCSCITDPAPSNCDLHGVELILETVRRHPDVTLVGIGPYTNLAMAIRMDPQRMKKVRMVLMGGAFSAVYPEWNILCDPEAAHIVLTSGAQVEMIGLDVTVRCVLPPKDLERIRTSGSCAGKLLSAMTDVWMKTSAGKKVTLHDPLTVAYLLEPQLFQMEHQPVAVQLEGGPCHASTAVLATPFRVRTPLPPKNVWFARNAEVDRAREIIMKRIFPV